MQPSAKGTVGFQDGDENNRLAWDKAFLALVGLLNKQSNDRPTLNAKGE